MKHIGLVVGVGVVGMGVLLLLGAGGGSMPAGRAQEEAAYFRFDIPPDPETFVIELSDADKIATARAILAGQEPDLHVMGQIVKQPIDYNPPWGFHLAPESIEFFHSAIEVCDASILYVEQHLDEACGAFLPGCTWCPWGSRLVEEVEGNGEERIYLPVVVR